MKISLERYEGKFVQTAASKIEIYTHDSNGGTESDGQPTSIFFPPPPKLSQCQYCFWEEFEYVLVDFATREVVVTRLHL